MENVCIFAKVVMIGKSRIEQDKVFRSLLNAFFFSFYISLYCWQCCQTTITMKTKLSLEVGLRVEVGRIVKVLLHFIDAIGRLSKMIGLNL